MSQVEIRGRSRKDKLPQTISIDIKELSEPVWAAIKHIFHSYREF
jgi:actin-like ATPase involved in cell morphogenesis